MSQIVRLVSSILHSISACHACICCSVALCAQAIGLLVCCSMLLLRLEIVEDNLHNIFTYLLMKRMGNWQTRSEHLLGLLAALHAFIHDFHQSCKITDDAC